MATRDDLEAFAKELEGAPRLVVGETTAIGDAIDFAHDALDACPFASARRVIDVSGDGASQARARDQAGFVILTTDACRFEIERHDRGLFCDLVFAIRCGAPGCRISDGNTRKGY